MQWVQLFLITLNLKSEVRYHRNGFEQNNVLRPEFDSFVKFCFNIIYIVIKNMETFPV